MNIREAKQAIIDTVKAYTGKDETGAYLIPPEKQRPLLIIGPPGVGKTAIVAQAAQECGINLVAYTITHHTRQSAIGLPFISHQNFGGKEFAVTEYTMSEIIASVYQQIEKSGISEGILFLDEINCVSETLAPTMLQFLQYKMFGTHRLPEGFIIVTAGNPPQYNKSVRDFDIATLDRVRRITVEEDFNVWKEYAYRAGVHGSILAYLQVRRQNFYSIRTEVEEKYFVTARGWEDLSRAIQAGERLGIPVTKNLTAQYLQDPQIAEDFASYYELYNKYREVYRVPEILKGTYPENAAVLSSAPFDEKLSLLSLLTDALNQQFRGYDEDLAVQEILLKQLQRLRTALRDTKESAADLLREYSHNMAASLAREEETGLTDREEQRKEKLALSATDELIRLLTAAGGDAGAAFAAARAWFDARESKRQESIAETDRCLTHSFEFVARTFGEGQEMVIFLSELTAGYYSLKFVHDCGNEAYSRYNKLLLLEDRQQELRAEVLRVMETQ